MKYSWYKNKQNWMQIFFFYLFMIGSVFPEPPLSNYARDEGYCKDFQNDFCEPMRRWHVDETTATCEMFNYLGSGGNFNNFESLEQCEQHMKFTPREKLKGCKQQFVQSGSNKNCEGNPNKQTKYYFSRSSGQSKAECIAFQYNGCGGNFNRYDNKTECENYCGRKDNDPPNLADCHIKPEFDDQLPDVGIVFSPELNHCIYGAVGKGELGKRGSFKSFGDCVTVCLKNTGNMPAHCGDHIPHFNRDTNKVGIRFYYSSTIDRCVLFESYEDDLVDTSNLDTVKSAGKNYNRRNNFPNVNTCAAQCGAGKQDTSVIAYNVCNMEPGGFWTHLGHSDYDLKHMIVDKPLSRFIYDNKFCMQTTYNGFRPQIRYFSDRTECSVMCLSKNSGKQKGRFPS